jgi:hypothetical protein
MTNAKPKILRATSAPANYEARLRTLLKKFTADADQMRAALIQSLSSDNATATDTLDNVAQVTVAIRCGRYADELRARIDMTACHANDIWMYETALLYVQTLGSMAAMRGEGDPTEDALRQARAFARNQFIEAVRDIR